LAPLRFRILRRFAQEFINRTIIEVSYIVLVRRGKVKIWKGGTQPIFRPGSPVTLVFGLEGNKMIASLEISG